jgi:hypothetical protein
VGFVVGKVALGQVFSEDFGFSLSIFIQPVSSQSPIIWGWYNRPVVAAVPTVPPHKLKKMSHVGYVVDKVALGQVFSEDFGFPCQSSFHQFLHNHYHLSSGAGTIGQ